MQKRLLGDTTVSAIGLGCMGMSQAYGVQDEKDSVEALHRAVELGITFFDTAEVYGPYRNEILLGKALKSCRDQVTIATKFGFTFNPQRTDFGEITGTNGHPDNARAVAEASLKRLQTDVIDLFYLHRVDPAVPVEETVGAMAELVKEGKVRMIGLSEISAATLRKAHAIHPISALQSEYSLWTRDVETNGVLETCQQLGIAFVPFSPLGRGFLTGTVSSSAGLKDDDFRKSLPRFQPENAAINQQYLDILATIAASKGCTLAQVALAWVLAQGDNIIPIPGAKRIPYIEQNIAATSLLLSREERDTLEKAFCPENIAGSRYPEVFEKMAAR